MPQYILTRRRFNQFCNVLLVTLNIFATSCCVELLFYSNLLPIILLLYSSVEAFIYYKRRSFNLQWVKGHEYMTVVVTKCK